MRIIFVVVCLIAFTYSFVEMVISKIDEDDRRLFISVSATCGWAVCFSLMMQLCYI